MKNLITLLLLTINFICYSQDGDIYQGDRNFWAIEVKEMNEKTFTKYDIDSIETEIITLINSLRIENGLSIVTVNDYLSSYSNEVGEILLEQNQFEHSNISDNGIVVENLFKISSFGTIPFTDERLKNLSNEIFNYWLTSTYHKLNMLSPNIKTIGVSINVEYSENYTVISTMVGK